MLPVKWIRCVFFPVLLFSSHQYRGTDSSGNRTNYKCWCFDENGAVYNLAPLQRDESDVPRFFTAEGTKDWEYGYSPCRSFSKSGHCTGDNVAVCQWYKDGVSPGDYNVIGCQSNFFCGTDTKSNKPQLEYTAIKNPDWKVIIKLECNLSLDTVYDAKFEVYQDKNIPWEFTFIHKCACPNACLEGMPTSGPPLSTPPSTPTSTPIGTVIIGVFGGLLAVTLCAFAVVFCRRRLRQSNLDIQRRRLMDQNGGNRGENLTYQSNNESRHLADREENGSQHLIDSFIKNPIGRRSQSRSCNIRELKKDNVNKLNAPL